MSHSPSLWVNAGSLSVFSRAGHVMLVVIFARLTESEWRGYKQKHNDYKNFGRCPNEMWALFPWALARISRGTLSTIEAHKTKRSRYV